ncbi:MAG: cysteine dioxygenase family protein [Saprospiraceae bacterium]
MKQLPQLIYQLKSKAQITGIDNVLEILAEFETYRGDDWKTYFEKKEPTNVLLLLESDLKLTLIYWPAFQKSNKHKHPPGGGLMRVLSGQLQETRFDPTNPEKELGKYECPTGALTYIHDELALHVVENPNRMPAVSLHVYALRDVGGKVL